jgi:hypothetical protein
VIDVEVKPAGHTDVALDAGGSWRWSSLKREMHAAVRGYFAQRLEDGAPAEPR